MNTTRPDVHVSHLSAHRKAASISSADAALVEAETVDLGWWQPEIARLRGDLALAGLQVDGRDAEYWYRTAIGMAQEQEAKSFELRTGGAGAPVGRYGGSRPGARAACAGGEQDERKCRPDRRPCHDPIGTPLCRCRQYECAANSTGADCAEKYAVGLRAAGNSCTHQKRQKRPNRRSRAERSRRTGSRSRADPDDSERSANRCGSR